jgi:hypothetical protein
MRSDLHWAVEVARLNLVVNGRLLLQGGSLLYLNCELLEFED